MTAPEASPPLDLSTPLTVHVVGIGGAGMSAIATVLAAMGHTVTGSDLKDSPVLDRLRAAGLTVAVGHRPDNLGTPDVVTVSSAVGESNPEVVEARRRGVPVLARAETLAAIAALRRCIAVGGTHGKTTTASMLALQLVEAGLHPSFLIGGDVNEIGTNAVWDDGEWLVVEADESDGTFLSLTPAIAVVTNVEPDHLDHYGTFEAVQAAFEEFLAGASLRRVAGGDDPAAASIGARAGADTVGTAETCTRRMVRVELARSSVAFDLLDDAGRPLGHLSVPVPGLHNARNAAVATVAALAAGVPFEASARALARFAGVARRFEFRGSARGVTFVDDYAHLPTEVSAVLAAAKGGDGPGWWRCSSPTATGAPRSWGRSSAPSSATPTWWWSPTSTAPARRRSPGCPAGWWPTPSIGPCPTGRSTTCPVGRSCCRWWARCSSRATCA